MSTMGRGLRKGMVVVGVLALVVPLLLAWAAPVSAATITVCSSGCDYTTIQDAVDNAGGGDVIEVYPGTYNESVDLGGHSGALTLRTVNNAGNPTPGTATVDGGTAGSAFYMSTTHSGNITVDGFVVESTDNDAMNLQVSSNIVIRNVTASDSGEDGIDVEADGNVTISDCTVSNNDSDGIYVDDAENVTISDCIANGNDDENIDVDEAYGDVNISGCTANSSEEGYGIEVDYVDGNLEVSTCTANGNYSGGIDIEGVQGSVTITDCTANTNDEEGIEVEGEETEAALREGEAEESELDEDEVDDGSGAHESVGPSANGGGVTITNCTAEGNGEDGISVWDVNGDVIISNCTARGNDDDGFEPNELRGAVEVSASIAQDNGDDGVDLWYMEEADSILVNGNIICGNASDGLELAVQGDEQAAIAATSADATGNWWGCAGGPGAAGCDTVAEIDGSVDYTPWIETITSGASVDPVGVGQPTVVSFQFRGGPPAVYLGEGPGDLRGPGPFTVSTDNGTLDGNGSTVEAFVGANGMLQVTLVPDTVGTATVTVSGPCGLAELEGATAVVGVVAAAEFVPEPGTVLLLGSGLMGLAGYAGLRLRKR